MSRFSLCKISLNDVFFNLYFYHKRVYVDKQITNVMWKSVMKLFMIYKAFQPNMENVLMMKQEKFIRHVFVSECEVK